MLQNNLSFIHHIFSAPIRTDLPEPKTRLNFLKCECIDNSTSLIHLIPFTDNNTFLFVSSKCGMSLFSQQFHFTDSYKLTFDLNTANKELVLSDGNRRVTRKRTTQFYPDHPERFDGFCQILCKEPLSGIRHYWEVEWHGEFSIGVAYKSISRKGKNTNSLLGYNDKSWSLLCSDSGYSAWHNKMDKDLPGTARVSRIGVYLDYAGGSVSFYSVSETMELIHRFKAKFSEALYAGFGVGSSVTLCMLDKNYRADH